MTSTGEPSVRRFPPDGPACGPPVLLVHGFASDGAADWVASGVAAALTAAGRPVVVPDLPGHGAGPAPADAADTTASAMARGLAAVATGGPPTGTAGGPPAAAAAGAPVDVVGYSLGARLAWELPALLPVRRLVLGGISPVEPFGALDLPAARAYAAGGPVPADPLTAAIAALVTAPGRDADALLRCAAGLGAEPFRPAAGAIGVPTRFIAGAGDAVSAGIERLVELVPGADLVRVPGDHQGALRDPAFTAAVLAFLAA